MNAQGGFCARGPPSRAGADGTWVLGQRNDLESKRFTWRYRMFSNRTRLIADGCDRTHLFPRTEFG
jgi:hypothetical protein